VRMLSPSRRTRAAAWLTAVASAATVLATVGATTGAAPVRHAAKHYTIALIPGLTTDPFYISMGIGAQAAAKKLGVTLLWQGAPTWSVSQQTPYVAAMVSRHVNAILIAPTDVKQLIPPIRNAVKAGIPVITVDTTIADQSLLKSAITSNNFQGGEVAAKMMAQQIGGKGEVAVINTLPGISTTDARQAGFVAEMKHFPQIKIVAMEYDNDQQTTAETDAQHILLRYPGLKGIFGTNLYSAVGAAAGVEQAGKIGAVKVFGYDAEPLEVQDLQKGLLSAIVAQKPYLEGYLGVEYAVDVLEGKAVPKSVQLPNVVITKANLKANAQWIYKTHL
jgi:ribose transport system substrate-binding protein